MYSFQRRDSCHSTLRSDNRPRLCTGCSIGFRGLVADVKLMVRNAGFALRGGGRGEVCGRGYTLVGAGSQLFLQSMTRVALPELDGLKQGEHRGCQFRTPDTTRTVVFPACNGITDRLFRSIIDHGNFRMSDKNGKALPVILQAGQHLALCHMQLPKPALWR